jgi:NYN domain
MSLSALVRRWMATSQDVEAQRLERGGEASPSWPAPVAAEAAPTLDPALVAPESVVEYPDPEVVADLVGQGDPEDGARSPLMLPRRRRGRTQPQLARRIAVLIDARTIAPEAADGLFDKLADHGCVNVARAYGDWTAPGAQAWMPRLRHHGVQPCHQFSQERDDRSLVALTIDAVDLAREAAVDAVAIVGDLTSAYPLVQRLNASGVAVLAFGASDSPDDVRGLCEEFTDMELLDTGRLLGGGRHRA